MKQIVSGVPPHPPPNLVKLCQRRRKKALMSLFVVQKTVRKSPIPTTGLKKKKNESEMFKYGVTHSDTGEAFSSPIGENWPLECFKIRLFHDLLSAAASGKTTSSGPQTCSLSKNWLAGVKKTVTGVFSFQPSAESQQGPAAESVQRLHHCGGPLLCKPCVPL